MNILSFVLLWIAMGVAVYFFIRLLEEEKEFLKLKN